MKKQRSMEKVMYAVFFIITGQVKATKMEKHKTNTANWSIAKYLPEIHQEVNVR